MSAPARSRADARRARTRSADASIDQLAAAITQTSDVRHERQDTESPSPLALRWASKFLVSDAKSREAVARRSSDPIRCYLGSNGSGKTLMAVHDLLPSLNSGRTVYSTVPLFDASTGELHPNYVPFTSWEQLMKAEHADFLADEISAIAASRDHHNLHPEVINRMHQLRKIDVTFSWTAPAWRRADLSLREVTWSVNECRSYLSDRRGAAASGTLWAPNRLFVARTYSMRDFDEWSSGKRDQAPLAMKEWFNGVGSVEFRSYDTYAAVEKIEGYDPNSCPECGLTVRKMTCKGHGS